MDDLQGLMGRLRAAAEPSRLRLLAILAAGELSVTELTQVLGQSQPRVSRHLKLLCDAGLLEKFREQHWIFYRVPADGPGQRLVVDLLGRIRCDDAALVADRARLEAVLAHRQRGGPDGDHGGASPALAELPAAFAAELGDSGRAALFYFGRAPTEVLGVVASRARRVVGMHSSRVQVQRARAVLHSRGLSHCVLQQGELTSLPHPAGEFDAVIVDRALAAHARPVEALRETGRLLREPGDLIVAEAYDALAARAPGANPLATLKDWMAQAGLVCARLHPADLDGEHLVLAVARARDVVSVAA
jgi:ArsR family transcriptional regulator